LLSTAGVLISLALASSGICNSLQKCNLKLEARVGIGPFSPQLRVKNAHFSEQINLNLLNQTKPILTGLVSVLVSAQSVKQVGKNH
jgi:hypothetical protein